MSVNITPHIDTCESVNSRDIFARKTLILVAWLCIAVFIVRICMPDTLPKTSLAAEAASPEVVIHTNARTIMTATSLDYSAALRLSQDLSAYIGEIDRVWSATRMRFYYHLTYQGDVYQVLGSPDGELLSLINCTTGESLYIKKSGLLPPSR